MERARDGARGEHESGETQLDDAGSGVVVARPAAATSDPARFSAMLAGISILTSLVPFALSIYWGARAALSSGPTLDLTAKAVIAFVLGLILLLNGRLLFPDRTGP